MSHLEISSKKTTRRSNGYMPIYNKRFSHCGCRLDCERIRNHQSHFYNYFHSKEKFIEMCIAFQKSVIKDEVLSIIYSNRYYSSSDKLKEIVRLHVCFNSLYHLLLKAVFEIRVVYPQGYSIAIEYRKWLLHEIFDLIYSGEIREPKFDANMVVNLIDGLLLQVLSSNSLEERDAVMEQFFKISV